jgi:hypothetical protein
MLGDMHSKPEDIARTPGMKKYLFEMRINRLLKLEKLAKNKLKEGLDKWFTRQYLS